MRPPQLADEANRGVLQRWARGRSIPARLVQRAKIILRAAAGRRNGIIAVELRTDRLLVGRWRNRLSKWVDEKSHTQMLDRTQPGLPIKNGRCGAMTHNYKRNGTTTLFAALPTLDGKVLSKFIRRHRHQERIKFLKLIDRQTPAALEPPLIADNYATHKRPKVQSFIRTAKADGILAKVRRARTKLDKIASEQDTTPADASIQNRDSPPRLNAQGHASTLRR